MECAGVALALHWHFDLSLLHNFVMNVLVSTGARIPTSYYYIKRMKCVRCWLSLAFRCGNSLETNKLIYVKYIYVRKFVTLVYFAGIARIEYSLAFSTRLTHTHSRTTIMMKWHMGNAFSLFRSIFCHTLCSHIACVCFYPKGKCTVTKFYDTHNIFYVGKMLQAKTPLSPNHHRCKHVQA